MMLRPVSKPPRLSAPPIEPRQLLLPLAIVLAMVSGAAWFAVSEPAAEVFRLRVEGLGDEGGLPTLIRECVLAVVWPVEAASWLWVLVGVSALALSAVCAGMWGFEAWRAKGQIRRG
jgi:hypothetical protein